ncbi:MAG: hypothetical protein AVDCRST_MAG68-1159, partial [uncultured Gemmatimonadetes bacterium]
AGCVPNKNRMPALHVGRRGSVRGAARRALLPMRGVPADLPRAGAAAGRGGRAHALRDARERRGRPALPRLPGPARDSSRGAPGTGRRGAGLRRGAGARAGGDAARAGVQRARLRSVLRARRRGAAPELRLHRLLRDGRALPRPGHRVRAHGQDAAPRRMAGRDDRDAGGRREVRGMALRTRSHPRLLLPRGNHAVARRALRLGAPDPRAPRHALPQSNGGTEM